MISQLSSRIIIVFVFLSLMFNIPSPVRAQPGKLDTGLVNATVSEKGDLQIVPSATSSEKDFDFFYGSWDVTGKRLKERLKNSHEWLDFTAKLRCSKILKGIGNIEPFYTRSNGQDVEAFTLRLFDAKTKLWSIYYVNSNYVAMNSPQVGSFQNNIGWFYSRDTWDNKDIIIVYKWDRTNPAKPTMSQAFSTDNGKTWEWNYKQGFDKTGE